MAAAQGGGLPLPASGTRSFPPQTGGPLALGLISLQRQHCYLCDLPRTPWALLLSDYSEPVCRGCVNYEGPHRVEAAIDSARRLKQSLGATATVADSRPASGLPGHLISLPVPVSGRDDGMRLPVARAGDGVRLVGAGRGGAATAMDLVVGGQRVPVPSRANHHRGIDDPRAAVTSATTAGAGLPPPPPLPPRFPPPIPGFQLDTVGLAGGSLPLALVRSGLGDLPAVINGKRSGDPAPRSLLSPPCRPSDDVAMSNTTGRPEAVSPATAARSRMVVETLATLACSAPFDVRLKTDTAVVGRVLAFDAAKPGAATASQAADMEPLQLAMFVELPAGSGLVYGCCGESSPVGWQAAHVDGDSTPFRHLEYRIKPEVDDWRPLADLLPESVRCFRDPLDRSRLPVAGRPSLTLVDAAKAGAAALGYGWNAAAAAAAALHFPPFMRPFQLPNPLLPAAGRKRKAAPGVGDAVDPELGGTTTSTLHSRLDLAADGLAIKRRLWMQSQADALRLALAFPAAAAAAAAGPSDEVTDVGGPRQPPTRRSNSSSPPAAHARHQRTTSADESAVNHHQGSAHSPGPDISPTLPSSANGEVVGSGAGPNRDGGSPSPRCTLCRGRLEDTHFVQCPSVPDHKFCFPCSRDSIKQQLAAATAPSTNGPPPPTEVYCPSGERCPLLPGVAGGVPWAFMASEIETIIGSTGGLISDDQLVSTATTTTPTTSTTTATAAETTTTTSGGKDLKIKKERDS